MAAKAPTPDEMVQPTPEQRPARVDEPLTKSEKRDPDPFDLPPPG
jgi:hypothetical protein